MPLRRFPVDKVKIDRSFVAEVPADRDQGAIVSAIVALAHTLQIRVVAEGRPTRTGSWTTRLRRRRGCATPQPAAAPGASR